MLKANIPAGAGTVGLITVTAPGAHVLPWSESGRQVEERYRVRWNASAQRRWSEMHRKAVQNVRRNTGLQSGIISYVWQLQSRGVLHIHLVASYDTEAQKIWVRSYVKELRRLSEAHYFGFIDFRDMAGKTGKPSVMASEKAAGYLASYLAESRQFVEATALADRPRRLVYVARRVTRTTFCTMRRLRRVRYLWVIRNSGRSVVSRAGTFPSWFRDRSEYAAVCALAQGP